MFQALGNAAQAIVNNYKGNPTAIQQFLAKLADSIRDRWDHTKVT